MNNVIFSHRPNAGVSVGAYSDGTKLYVAVALVNDGTSRKGLFHADRRDSFSRKGARLRIAGRITKMIEAGTCASGITFDTTMPAHKFMGEFRELFKPTPDESDNVLTALGGFGGVEVHHRPSADTLFDTVMILANKVIANESASV
jgi:hypothetical protein